MWKYTDTTANKYIPHYTNKCSSLVGQYQKQNYLAAIKVKCTHKSNTNYNLAVNLLLQLQIIN